MEGKAVRRGCWWLRVALHFQWETLSKTPGRPCGEPGPSVQDGVPGDPPAQRPPTRQHRWRCSISNLRAHVLHRLHAQQQANLVGEQTEGCRCPRVPTILWGNQKRGLRQGMLETSL